ncbi:hypothetical protein G647_08097 [Cladophialophora carrionii CBS 160.54]|uniref:Uncharacterized protein n=1 Tax=Cladophialophora carrionii CBS 160.54 TaxID=1279043 RepID=V9D1A7_9EURO|nr:uncharacterized protein G647_08097 [Cladophialophora carrionii CBS 160.54]ETI20063.1 hypothetical protein G647_08097 [Cladophialophora carrionii CBS 160.54]
MAERVDLVRNAHHGVEHSQERPRLTIRQLREAAQKETLAKELAKASQKAPGSQTKEAAAAATAPQKKKQSIFGGLFQVREPTSVALNQVAAQMIAQHGSTSATKVPNVRLEKMPDFVPKVNSKWDGIPESVKQREKKEKEKEKQNAKAESFFSADSKAGDSSERRRGNSRNSSSTTGSSFGGFANSSGSQSGSSRTRFYAQSFNSSGDLVSQQRTDASVFSRSPPSQPAGDSIPEEPFQLRHQQSSAGMGHHPGPRNDIGLDTPKPFATTRSRTIRPRSTKSCASDTSGPPRPSAMDKSLEHQRNPADEALAWESIDWAQAARSYAAPIVRSISQQAASPASSQDRYLATTSQQQAPGLKPGINELSLHAVLSEGPDEAGLSVVRKKISHTRITDSHAFLAGEAQELVLVEERSGYHKAGSSPADRASAPATVDGGRPRVQQDLEKRPDSSRERLGLRASMLFADEITPWEKAEQAQLPPPSPKPEHQAPNTSKRFHKSFGKLGK